MNSRDEGVLRGPRQPGSGAARNSARLLIADAVHSYRRFVKQVLESTGDLKVVGEAADGEEVVRLAQQSKPDVVLMDIDLPDLDRSEEHTSELQSRGHLVCRLLLEKKK